MASFSSSVELHDSDTEVELDSGIWDELTDVDDDEFEIASVEHRSEGDFKNCQRSC